MKKYDEFEEYEYEDEYETHEEKTDVVPILSFISNCFIFLGIIIAIILLIVFIVTGKLMTAIFYVLGLVVAFFFGYGFMYCLDHFVDHS